MVQRNDVGSRLVGESDRVVWLQVRGDVSNVVDPGRVELRIRAVITVGDRNVISGRILDPVGCPDMSSRLSRRKKARVGRPAELDDTTALRPYLEPGRAGSCDSAAYDLCERFQLSTIFSAIRAVCSCNGNKSLAVEAKPIIRVIIDPAENSVLGSRTRTTADRRNSGKLPPHAEQAISCMTRVTQRQFRSETRSTRRSRDIDLVICCPVIGHLHLARECHGLSVSGSDARDEQCG